MNDPKIKCQLKFWRQRRHAVAFVAFFGYFNVYSLTVNLNVAIVAMTEVHLNKLPNGTVIKEKEFEFSSNFRGVVLSSYYYGTICSFIIGGCLATRYGGRVVLIITAFMGSFLTIAIPELSKINAYFIVVLRTLLGSCMGMVFPAMNEIWSKWAPIYERTSLASFAISGCFFGNVYTSASAGYIAKYLGWPAVFYITGLFSLIWAIVCGKIIKNDPAHDKYISNEELEYIKNSTKQITSEKVIVPWRKMLTSTPVWAVIVTHFCGNWGMFTLLTELPTFLHEVWQYDIKSVGYLSALPYIANSASLLISGQLADKLLKSELLTKTCVRKLFLCLAFFVEIVFLIAASTVHNAKIIIICLMITMAADAFSWCTFGVNFLDIATQYAAILMGISCTFAFIPGIVSPLLTGIIVTDKKDYEQWKYVFINTGFIYVVGAIFYGIFGSAELQHWAKSGDDSTETINA